MKKLFLTSAVALMTLVASAQFTVVTTYDGDQEETMDKVTQNFGIGYALNDSWTVGLIQNVKTLKVKQFMTYGEDTILKEMLMYHFKHQLKKL